MKVTPWEVSGRMDYDKLIKEFGTERINKKLLNRIEKHTGELHHFLRRGIFFSHRSLNWLLDEYEKGNEFFLYTGRSPSGHVHLGHLVPWMFTKWLQDKFDVELWFQFPDEEKFLFKDDLTLDDTSKYLHENMLDVIAVGFDPEKTHFLVDTEHAGLMYKHACRVAKKITFNMVRSSFGFNNSNNVGEIFYTAMQSVPAFLPSVIKGKNTPCLIPYAIDQDPHFRLARDILPKLGYYKPAAIHSVFLPSLRGPEGKMSSSKASTAIYTTDSPEKVREKVMKHAYSGGRVSKAEHRKHGGNPDVDTSYQWLTFFEESDKKLKKVYDDYKSGDLLTGELKQILVDKVNNLLKEHQERREKAKNRIDEFIY